MKNHSVLTRRAMVFTFIITLTVVVIAIPVFSALSRHEISNRTEEKLEQQTAAFKTASYEYASGNSAPIEYEAAIFSSVGGYVWLLDEGGQVSYSSSSVDAPDIEQDRAYGVDVGGIRCAVQRSDLSEGGSLIVAAPIEKTQTAQLIAALAAGLLVSGILFVPLLKIAIVRGAVEPIKDLRDVAVKLASGDLDNRANEHLSGELGELGLALNNLSGQLSRSMYSLIIERNRLKHMLDGLSEGIVAVGPEGSIDHINPALSRMFKVNPSVHVADPRLKVIPDMAIWNDFDNVMRSGEEVTRNFQLGEMTCRMTISPIIDELGSIAGAVGLFSDITQMERLERTRREYVANVSHELRTPLTAMRALIEPLKEGMVTSDETRNRYYDIIHREVLRLSRLINDQLELSRLQSGTVSISKKRILIEELVMDICDRYSMIAEEHGLSFEMRCDLSACPAVYSNADRVEQMLVILLDNAIKYTEPGGMIYVGARWDDKRVVLSVGDTGIGISSEDLDCVFDRFYKVDRAHSGKGSGLGLSIAKELLARMGEEIWVESEGEGKGSEFSFTLALWNDKLETKDEE